MYRNWHQRYLASKRGRWCYLHKGSRGEAYSSVAWMHPFAVSSFASRSWVWSEVTSSSSPETPVPCCRHLHLLRVVIMQQEATVSYHRMTSIRCNRWPDWVGALVRNMERNHIAVHKATCTMLSILSIHENYVTVQQCYYQNSQHSYQIEWDAMPRAR